MMKKILSVSLLAFALYACGNNNNETTSTGGENANAPVATPAEGKPGAEDTAGTVGGTNAAPGAAQAGAISAADADKGLELIGKSDCLGCHKVEDKLVGPSYRDVANKYPADEATVKSLAGKIIKGGAGNWGQIAMSPHPNLSQEDAELMAKYVLSLKQ